MCDNVINATWRFLRVRFKAFHMTNLITPIPKQKLTKKLIKQLRKEYGSYATPEPLYQFGHPPASKFQLASEAYVMKIFAEQSDEHYGEFLAYAAKWAPELFNEWALAYWRARPYEYELAKQRGLTD